MRILALFMTLIFVASSTADERNQSLLQSFVSNYPGVPSEVKDADLQALFDHIKEKSLDYSEFYDGPADDKLDSPERREWREEKKVMAGKAEELVKLVLDTYRSEDINFFQLEMMKLYLDNKEARPAIIEIMGAFAALKFNGAYYDAIENQKDTLPHVVHGAIGGMAVAILACRFRPSMCQQLVKMGKLHRSALEASKNGAPSLTRSQRIANTIRSTKKVVRRLTRTERTWKELLEEVPRAEEPIQSIRTVKTVGGKGTRMSYFFKYMRLGSKEKRIGMKYLAIGSGGGALGWTSYQKLQNAYRDGKWDYTELDPNDLERRYFGALALLEMSCQAKQIDLEAEMPYEQLRDYILSMHEELIILGRMSGGIKFYDKVPLEFVTPLPEANEILVQLPLADDLPIGEDGNPIGTFKRACPGIATQGEDLHSSYSELEGIYQSLIIKASEMAYEEAQQEEEPPPPPVTEALNNE